MNFPSHLIPLQCQISPRITPYLLAQTLIATKSRFHSPILVRPHISPTLHPVLPSSARALKKAQMRIQVLPIGILLRATVPFAGTSPLNPSTLGQLATPSRAASWTNPPSIITQTSTNHPNTTHINHMSAIPQLMSYPILPSSDWFRDIANLREPQRPSISQGHLPNRNATQIV